MQDANNTKGATPLNTINPLVTCYQVDFQYEKPRVSVLEILGFQYFLQPCPLGFNNGIIFEAATTYLCGLFLEASLAMLISPPPKTTRLSTQ